MERSGVNRSAVNRAGMGRSGVTRSGLRWAGVGKRYHGQRRPWACARQEQFSSGRSNITCANGNAVGVLDIAGIRCGEVVKVVKKALPVEVLFTALALVFPLQGCGATSQTPPPLTQAVSIVTQPVSATVPLDATTTLSVTAGGSPPFSYQWSKDGVAITGATSASYTTPPIATSDNGAKYTVTVSNKANSVTSAAATITVGARAPAPGDLRFQMVDFWAKSDLVTGEDGSGVLFPHATFTYPDWIGSPLEIGDESCGSNDNCAWQFWTNGLTPGTTGLTLIYKSGEDANFAPDLAAMNAPNRVMLCLDLEPKYGIYGSEWMQTSQGGGFQLTRQVVGPGQIASTAAQDGLESRVITAVSFDASGQANLMAYGWQQDTTTQYDTQVELVADPQNVGAAGTQLANAGYIITAFGGDDQNGYVLIGTKVHGDTMQRGFQVINFSLTPSGTALSGVAPVGRLLWDQGSSNQGTIAMMER